MTDPLHNLTFHVERDELTATQRQLLVDTAMQYIEAGCPPWDLWTQLSEESRAAMAEAGRIVWQERAAHIGLAAMNPEGQAQLMAPADDGAALANLHLTRALDKLEESRRAEAAQIKSPRHARRVTK